MKSIFKKTILVLGAILLFSLSPFAGIAAGSLAVIPIFSKPSLSIEDIEKLAESNFSSFNGEDYNQFSSYDGSGYNALVDASRIFTINLSNTTTAITNVPILLVPGLDFALGGSGTAANATTTGVAKVPGVLYEGIGQFGYNGGTYSSSTGVMTQGTAMSTLTASGSPKSLYNLYAYLMDNPTLLNLIKIYSGTTNYANCTGVLTYQEQSPFQTLQSTVIPISQNRNESAFNQAIATVNLLPYNIIAGNQSQLIMNLNMAATDNISIELYFAKTNNSVAQLKQQIVGAKQLFPNLVKENTMGMLPNTTQQVTQLPYPGNGPALSLPVGITRT